MMDGDSTEYEEQHDNNELFPFESQSSLQIPTNTTTPGVLLVRKSRLRRTLEEQKQQQSQIQNQQNQSQQQQSQNQQQHHVKSTTTFSNSKMNLSTTTTTVDVALLNNNNNNNSSGNNKNKKYNKNSHHQPTNGSSSFVRTTSSGGTGTENTTSSSNSTSSSSSFSFLKRYGKMKLVGTGIAFLFTIILGIFYSSYVLMQYEEQQSQHYYNSNDNNNKNNNINPIIDTKTTNHQQQHPLQRHNVVRKRSYHDKKQHVQEQKPVQETLIQQQHNSTVVDLFFSDTFENQQRFLQYHLRNKSMTLLFINTTSPITTGTTSTTHHHPNNYILYKRIPTTQQLQNDDNNNSNTTTRLYPMESIFDHYSIRRERLIHGWSKNRTTATSNNHNRYSYMEREIDMRQLNRKLQFQNVDGGVWKQGYDIIPPPLNSYQTNSTTSTILDAMQQEHNNHNHKDPLRIYVVPHSHCDPGWIKTFDEYFHQQTSQIITTIVTSLSKESKRKFIWAEISYFAYWYNHAATPILKEQVKTLLEKKQFEFVTGGWVQPDEANTQLYAMETQLRIGHEWINQTFGEQYIPVYGWSIDPFGYSNTATFLWQQYKYRAIVIQRVHYEIKKYLAKHQHLEFYWRQTWDTNEHPYNHTNNHNDNNNNNNKNENDNDDQNYDLFTHVMPFFSYDIPHTCGPDPSICCQFDFRRMYHREYSSAMSCPWNKPPIEIKDSNVQERSLLLLDQYLKKATLYEHNAVLIPLGDDFRYETVFEADEQYNNYQRIFDYINTNVPGVQVQFGTLGDYFNYILPKQKEKEQRILRTTTTSTGTTMTTTTPKKEEGKEYFDSTIPILKGSFFTYSDVNEDYWSGYFTSRVFDKALDRHAERILYVCESLVHYESYHVQMAREELSLFQHHDGITGTAKNHVVNDYAQRMYRAIEVCQFYIIQSFYTFYRTHFIRTTIEQKEQQETQKGTTTTIIDFNHIIPCFYHDPNKEAPRQKGYNENQCIGTTVIAYNPLNIIQTCNTIQVPPKQFQLVQLPCEVPGGPTMIVDDTMNDPYQQIKFDSKTGMMIQPIQEEWMVWKVHDGGAYLFVPGQLVSYQDHVQPKFTIEHGGYVVRTESWTRTIIRKEIPIEYHNDDTSSSSSKSKSTNRKAIVFDFIYETHLTTDNNEWIVRYSSGQPNEPIQNQGVFHTDLNGYNFDTHYYRSDRPIQSQVYPMPTLACIQDNVQRLTVISEHAQGTSSLLDNTIDIWLDRRLKQDDNRGLFQGIQDNVKTRTKLRVMLEYYDNKNNNRIMKNDHDDNTTIQFNVEDEFDITPLAQNMWDTLQHPLELYGNNNNNNNKRSSTVEQ